MNRVGVIRREGTVSDDGCVVPLALVVGDQHAGPSPAPPNRPGCIICQDPTAPGSDWCPTHLTELREDHPDER